MVNFFINERNLVINMKIKFIEKEHNFDLTTGKIYDVIKIDEDGWYMVINDAGFEQSYKPHRFEVVKEDRPTTDKDYISKFELLLEQRRRENPLLQEANRLFSEMYPTKQFNSVYKLGVASMLAYLKNDLYKYFCKDCKEYIDLIVKGYKSDDDELQGFLSKLIK